MEKVTRSLEIVDLSKHSFRRTLDSLQESAHSLLHLTFQWKEIESYLDSSKSVLEERAKELQALEESIQGRALELEKKETEVCSIHESLKAKLSDLEKKEKELNLEHEANLDNLNKKIESMEKISGHKSKELDDKEKELALKLKQVEEREAEIRAAEKSRVEFEPLISLLAKSTGSTTTMPTNCSTSYLNEDLVKRNAALARMLPYLDPAKLVLDAIQGSCKDYMNKTHGENARLDSVVDSCILLLEKLLSINPAITRKVKQEATQLGIDWIANAKGSPNNNSRALGCLLFLAAYELASLTTPEVLFTLLDRFLLYEQAPKLFRLLGLSNKVSGALETLKKKEDYLATFRFICEFRLYKLCPGGRPGALLIDFMESSEKASRVIAGTVNSMEALKARVEKRKADAVMALEYITEKKAESMFPAKFLKMLIALTNNESAHRATEPVHQSYEKRHDKTNAVKNSEAASIIPYEHKSEAKRQRLTEPITPFQNSTVNQLGSVSVPSGEKIEKSGVNHQPDAKATNPLSTETKPNILSGSVNADMLREIVEKQPLVESDLSRALKCTPDPAKLVLDASMALSSTNTERVDEFKLLITSASCFALLDQLKKFRPQIGNPVKGDAKKLAVYWKDKLSKSKTDKMEVVCFLQFVGIFGIVSEFKANELLGLLDNSYWRTVSPDLCQFLGLVDAIPGFIQNLIKTGHRLKAIEYIYSFDMVHKFQPVSAILNDFLRITKESAEKSFRDAKNESAPQVAAIDMQVRSLRAAIKCITSHKLESEFQLSNLEEQIKSLLKLRRNPSDMTIKESQTAKPPNLEEVGSVTSSKPLEASSSSVSEPQSTKKKKKNRGEKRSLSSVHVASQPSNNNTPGPGHSYPLNQRLTWPVDYYVTTGTPNPGYHYNQWTQPQLHPPCYGPCCYRNHSLFGSSFRICYISFHSFLFYLMLSFFPNIGYSSCNRKANLKTISQFTSDSYIFFFFWYLKKCF